jgi:hypothetical protein
MAHIWHWLLNFMGINFGQNPFSTHMYNFWSGFGGDITEFALIGTLVAIYRNHVKSTTVLNGILKDVAHSHHALLHKGESSSTDQDIKDDSSKS